MGKSTDQPDSRYLEVERKFDVVESTVSPSFDGLASVARVERSPSQQLDAVYFDTPGRDLAAHHVTLRRRTGGPDAGWHLKLPAGPDARTEVREPLDASATDDVPESLRDVVLAIVRERPLAPVARISTSRTVDVLHGADGVALAEFCDDQVTAQADQEGPQQRWREWELELAAGGDRDLLDRLTNRLLDAGAVTGRARLQAGPRAGADARAGAEPRTAPVDPDAPGGGRTGRCAARMGSRGPCRRLRLGAPDAGEDTQDPQPASIVGGRVRHIRRRLDPRRAATAGRGAGVARDAEVLAERYERALDELPAELVRGPVRERLVDGAKRHYESGLRRSLIAMRSQRYFRLLDALEGLAAAEPVPAESGEDERGPVTIDSAYKRIRKAAKAASDADQADRDEALHRIRKGAKRLRYTAAATGADKVSDRAKTIQTLLGDHQDSVVSRAHLSEQAEVAHAAGEDTFTYGLLYQLEDDLARRSREQLDDALKKLDRSVRKRADRQTYTFTSARMRRSSCIASCSGSAHDMFGDVELDGDLRGVRFR